MRAPFFETQCSFMFNCMFYFTCDRSFRGHYRRLNGRCKLPKQGSGQKIKKFVTLFLSKMYFGDLGGY